MSGPCGWKVTKCGCGSCWSTYTPEVRETAEALATGIMWAATGRKYGLCDIVVQPCVKAALPRDYQTYEVGSPDYGMAYIHNGQWHNGCSAEGSSCCTGCELELEGPTTTDGITAVSENGVLLPIDSYLVMNGSILVRTDGECWSTCTNYSSQSPSKLQIEYKKGIAIPDHVQKATERLACEFAKACAGAACALPRRLKSITRQGVEATISDISKSSRSGGSSRGPIQTGVYEVDIVIQLENPAGRSSSSIVWSPDTIPPRVIS